MQNYFGIENQSVPFYLEPGQNLSIILNWEELKQPYKTYGPLKNITYHGTLEKTNTCLFRYRPHYSHLEFLKKEDTMEPIPFKKDMLQFKNKFLNKINAYEQSGELDKKTSELLKNDIILTTYGYLFSYYVFGNKKDIDNQTPHGYYDFIKELPLNKQSILVNDAFSSFINRLEYAPILEYNPKHQTNITHDFKDFSVFLKNKNVKITPEEKKLFDDIKKEKLKNKEVGIKLKEFCDKHESLTQEYLRIKYDENRIKNIWKVKDSLASNLEIKNNLFYEIIKVRSLKFELEHTKAKDLFWSELKKGIKSSHLLALGDKLLEQAISKSEFYPLPDNEKGTAIFKKIIAPYKGKDIFIKLCEYCKRNIEYEYEQAKTKKNIEDVVFLFISNENSNSKETDKASALKNGFKNFMIISQDDYNYLKQLFKTNKLTKTILVKKDGKVITKNYRIGNYEDYF